jgi:hypothetical protein
MTQRYDLQKLSDDELEAALAGLVEQHSSVTAELVAHIGELDHRRLFGKYACSSTFVYCQQRLHMSESMTGKHIRVARLARRFPLTLDLLRVGDIHLSNLVLLATCLTEANHRELLAAAKNKSKRQVELLLAEWFPRPDVPAKIRKLPTPVAKRTQAKSAVSTETSTTQPKTPTPRPGKVEPLAPLRFKVEFTADQQLYDNIEKAKELLGPRLPRGDLNELFGRAIELLVEDLEKKKYAKTSKPRRTKPKAADSKNEAVAKRSRHIPNEVKREVARRDDGQCTFVDEEGNRCEERWGLELHHDEVAFARGGQHTTANISLMCKTHNLYLAKQEFGTDLIAAKIDQARMKQRVTVPGDCSVKSERHRSGVSERRMSYRAGASPQVTATIARSRGSSCWAV